MLLVDDSGWGSLLGGVMIGVYDTDTNRFKSKLMPVSYFQGIKFTRAHYRAKAYEVFMDIMDPKAMYDHLQICRGTVLDTIYEELKYGIFKRLAKIERVEIKDPLQSLLEEKFAQHLHRIGVPRKSSGAHCLSFNEMLDWIKEDPKRVRYVKTGWPSWNQKYKKQLNLK